MKARRRPGAALALLSVALACALPADAAPRRVVSINLCTDLLLLEVAAPNQIAALTLLSRDPAMSPYATQAANHPATRGQVEELLQLQPDLILTTTGVNTQTVRLLESLGLPVESFPAPTTTAGIIDSLRRLGVLLDRAPEADALINRLQATPSPPHGSAWVLQAGGHTPGATTLAPALLEAAGLHDLATDTGFAGGGFVPLEQLVMSKADYLITPVPTGGGFSLAERFLAHPAFALDKARRITFDESLWSCGGAHFAAAVATLRQSLGAP